MWMWKKMCSYKPSLGRFNGLKSQRGFNMLGDKPKFMSRMMANEIFTMKAVGPMVGMPSQRNSYFQHSSNKINWWSTLDLEAWRISLPLEIQSNHSIDPLNFRVSWILQPPWQLVSLICTAQQSCQYQKVACRKKIFWLTNIEWWSA